MPVVTIGLSLHRPEMAPLLRKYMQKHDALFLEEPPTEAFDAMLSGRMSVGEYLDVVDTEYPRFEAIMCLTLRELKSQGKGIFPVEPYLENLIALHDHFAEGGRPDELDRETLTYLVYLAEKKATGALISYYQTAAAGSFEMIVDAARRFARIDAERFRLRDALRSQALTSLINVQAASFIEAGAMHYRLTNLIRRRATPGTEVETIFLAGDILKSWEEKGHLYGPGDQLTLLYIFHPAIEDKDRETLLAARALIYSKIVFKGELDADRIPYPHLRDELQCIKLTRQLSVDDCRQLFARIRGVDTSDARKIVFEYARA